MQRAVGQLASVAALAVFWTAEARAEDSRGQLGVEVRGFAPDDDAQTRDAGVAMVGRLEVSDESGPFLGRFRGFSRYDTLDRERSALLLEEAWFQVKTEEGRVRIGVDTMTWTGLEAFHPADSVNSRYLDSNLENPEKNGEPMLSATLNVFEGTLTGYLMPFYVAPVYPSPRSRQNPLPSGARFAKPLWVEADGAVSDNRLGLQWALRLEQVVDDADFAVHYLQHMDRIYPLLAVERATGTVHPLHLASKEIGGTYTQIVDAVVLKVEGAYRRFVKGDMMLSELTLAGAPDVGAAAIPLPRRDHLQLAVGLEYNLSHDSGSESTLVVEGQNYTVFPDDRRSSREQLSPFQRDLLLGYAYSLNDQAGRTLSAALIKDAELWREFLFTMSYQQRIGESWSLSAGLRLVYAPARSANPQTGLRPFDDADQVAVTVSRHF